MGVGAAIAGSAALSAGSQLLGAGMQSDAANSANNTQWQMYQQERNDLMPYMKTGMSANTAIGNLSGLNGGDPLSSPLLSPIKMDQATLQSTPGYQFNLAQGLKAVQNGAAARGLGSSGAALKGAATYATGLADSTYQNQFNNAVTNQTNQFNRLMGLTDLGQNSAAMVGNAGLTTGQGIAANTIGQGNTNAAGLIGAGSSAGGGAVGSSLINNLLGSNGGWSNNYNYGNLGANVGAPSANITWNTPSGF